MADRSSGDHPADLHGGAIEGQQETLHVAPLDGVRRGENRRHARPPRTTTSRARLTAAGMRDAIADARDVVARARDRAAEVRDLAIVQRDEADQQQDDLQPHTDADEPANASGLRMRATQRRAEDSEQRANAAEDRLAAARDREQAAFERRHAFADREIFGRQLAGAETDPVTGARTRVAGLIDLDRELDRCRRGDTGLVVALVELADPDRADRQDDAAGEELLKRVVAQMRANLRSYDLIIRLGDDELICAMSNVSVPVARERFAQLAASADRGSITIGFAQFTREETPTQLIALAGFELIASRQDDDGRR